MSELSEYLDFVFGDKSGYSFVPSKEPESEQWETRDAWYKWPDDRPKVVQRIEELGQIKDVYISPVLWKSPTKAIRSNFKVALVAYTEYDGNAQTIDDSTYPPSLKVQSSVPENQHVYFKLDKPIEDPIELEKINRVITYAGEGDPSAWDSTQVLRPTGSRNFKYDDHPTVKIVVRNTHEVLSTSIFSNVELPKKQIDTIDEKRLHDLDWIIAKYAFNQDQWELFNRDVEDLHKKRSVALMRLGYETAEMGMTPEDSFVILRAADDRWGKYKDRRDRNDRLMDIVNKTASKRPDKRRIQVMSALELASMDYSNISWLVEDLVLPGSINMVYALPGVGKTRLSLQLALSLSCGLDDFIGWKIPNRGKSMFLSLEMGQFALHRFVTGLASSEELMEAGDDFLLYPQGSSIFMDKVEGQRLLESLIQQQQPEMIVIDSLGKSISASLNSDENVAILFEFLNRMKEKYGVSFWFVHHSNKPSEKSSTGLTNAFGSIYITAEPDSILNLNKKGNIIKVRQDKARMSEERETFEILKDPKSLKFIQALKPEPLTLPLLKENNDKPAADLLG